MILIVLNGRFSAEISNDLQRLSDKLVEAGIAVTSNTITIPGVKMDLVTGLAIASLAVASISALTDVIGFWRSERPATYRIVFETREGSIVLDNSEAAKAAGQALREEKVTAIVVEQTQTT